MANPHFSILSRPTGRLVGGGYSYQVNFEKILRAAQDLDKIIELNCQPQWMDLPDTLCRIAKNMGVKIAICSEAQEEVHFDYLKHGVGQARRGWLEKSDVINTLPIDKLLKTFQHVKNRS
jgi:DNA polymerase (family 10)